MKIMLLPFIIKFRGLVRVLSGGVQWADVEHFFTRKQPFQVEFSWHRYFHRSIVALRRGALHPLPNFSGRGCTPRIPFNETPALVVGVMKQFVNTHHRFLEEMHFSDGTLVNTLVEDCTNAIKQWKFWKSWNLSSDEWNKIEIRGKGPNKDGPLTFQKSDHIPDVQTAVV